VYNIAWRFCSNALFPVSSVDRASEHVRCNRDWFMPNIAILVSLSLSHTHTHKHTHTPQHTRAKADGESRSGNDTNKVSAAPLERQDDSSSQVIVRIFPCLFGTHTMTARHSLISPLLSHSQAVTLSAKPPLAALRTEKMSVHSVEADVVLQSQHFSDPNLERRILRVDSNGCSTPASPKQPESSGLHRSPNVYSDVSVLTGSEVHVRKPAFVYGTLAQVFTTRCEGRTFLLRATKARTYGRALALKRTCAHVQQA
jgi:hypothetical protein